MYKINNKSIYDVGWSSSVDQRLDLVESPRNHNKDRWILLVTWEEVNIVEWEEYFVRQGKEKKHCLYTVKKRDEIYINHLKYYTNHLKIYIRDETFIKLC